MKHTLYRQPMPTDEATFTDRLIYWMADHPWAVGVSITVCIAIVGLFDGPVS